jgi:dTDP-4-dehydrorhamnose reductase
MGKEVNIEPIKSEELNLKAKRPKYSVLENRKMKIEGIPPFKHWSIALKEYLKEKGYGE